MKRLLILLPLLLGVSECHGTQPGTFVSMGHSYAVGSIPSLKLQTGCNVVDAAEGARISAAVVNLLPAYELAFPGYPGPVTVVLQIGNRDELPYAAPPRRTVEQNVTEIVTRLTAIRPDLAVVLLRTRGDCWMTFQDRLPELGPRFEYADLAEIEPAFEWFPAEHMADDCHPNGLGYSKRISTMLNTSALARDGMCW